MGFDLNKIGTWAHKVEGLIGKASGAGAGSDGALKGKRQDRKDEEAAAAAAAAADAEKAKKEEETQKMLMYGVIGFVLLKMLKVF